MKILNKRKYQFITCSFNKDNFHIPFPLFFFLHFSIQTIHSCTQTSFTTLHTRLALQFIEPMEQSMRNLQILFDPQLLIDYEQALI